MKIYLKHPCKKKYHLCNIEVLMKKIRKCWLYDLVDKVVCPQTQYLNLIPGV